MTNTIKVLYIEDNPADVYLLKEFFKEFKNINVEVHDSDRLMEALKALYNYKFDVILLDLSLPDSKGMETYEIIKMHQPDLPIIILSGFSDEIFKSYSKSKKNKLIHLKKGKFDSKTLESTIEKSITKYKRVET